MTLFDVCDEILKFVVAKPDKVFDYYNDLNKLTAFKTNAQSIYPAMFYLSSPDVGYLQKHLNGDNCALTPSGENFILAGGYAGERKREEDSKTEETELRKLDKQVKQLTIESYQYKQTIRDLEKELKRSTLLRNLGWLLAALMGIGATIAKWLIH